MCVKLKRILNSRPLSCPDQDTKSLHVSRTVRVRLAIKLLGPPKIGRFLGLGYRLRARHRLDTRTAAAWNVKPRSGLGTVLELLPENHSNIEPSLSSGIVWLISGKP